MFDQHWLLMTIFLRDLLGHLYPGPIPLVLNMTYSWLHW
jgi:hypothetical protein